MYCLSAFSSLWQSHSSAEGRGGCDGNQPHGELVASNHDDATCHSCCVCNWHYNSRALGSGGKTRKYSSETFCGAALSLATTQRSDSPSPHGKSQLRNTWASEWHIQETESALVLDKKWNKIRSKTVLTCWSIFSKRPCLDLVLHCVVKVYF